MLPLFSIQIAITTNPYQGLKQWRKSHFQRCSKIAITTNPYQGLKHKVSVAHPTPIRLQLPQTPIRD